MTVLQMSAEIANRVATMLTNTSDHDQTEAAIEEAQIEARVHAQFFTTAHIPPNKRQDVVIGLQGTIGKVQKLESPAWPGVAEITQQYQRAHQFVAELINPRVNGAATHQVASAYLGTGVAAEI